MNIVTINGQQHLQFHSLSEIASLKHLVTGKNKEIRRGEIDGLNYGLNVSDNSVIVTANRNEIADTLHIKNATVVIPVQTHSNNVAIVTQTNKDSIFNDTDALITNEPGIIIGVLSADCVPLLLADPVKNVVAAIHAGWRGTAATIAVQTLNKMTEEFGCDPADIVAGIGPSISAACYEVGDDVAAFFSEISKSKQLNGKTCIDLWKENEMQLIQAGVLKKNITISNLCTFTNENLFYSARREGIKTGRMGSFITLVE